jgi:hypothetical protein
MLEHIDRLRTLRALDLPAGIERQIHQNRLLKIAREGAQMTSADLMKFEPQRRYATLVALAVEETATSPTKSSIYTTALWASCSTPRRTNIRNSFSLPAKQSTTRSVSNGQVGQVLLEAKQSGGDPFVAIEAVISWDDFAASITEAQKLAQPEDFDFLYRIGESYATLCRYAPEFLDVLKLHAAPTAKPVLDAINLLREMNASNARKLPDDAPRDFIRKRWDKLVLTEGGIDRRYYELCAMSELKNALRSGDIWVEGSRQFKNFNEYLLPAGKFTAPQLANELPLAIDTECESYLHAQLSLLEQQLGSVDRMAASNDLPDAILTDSGLKITPLDVAVPQAAQNLIDHVATLLPHLKITELLLEVDKWTGFTYFSFNNL